MGDSMSKLENYGAQPRSRLDLCGQNVVIKAEGKLKMGLKPDSEGL